MLKASVCLFVIALVLTPGCAAPQSSTKFQAGDVVAWDADSVYTNRGTQIVGYTEATDEYTMLPVSWTREGTWTSCTGCQGSNTSRIDIDDAYVKIGSVRERPPAFHTEAVIFVYGTSPWHGIVYLGSSERTIECTTPGAVSSIYSDTIVLGTPVYPITAEISRDSEKKGDLEATIFSEGTTCAWDTSTSSDGTIHLDCTRPSS
jgi:hypothetical protein